MRVCLDVCHGVCLRKGDAVTQLADNGPGDLIKEAREARNWTMEDLARALNLAAGTHTLDRNAVYRWETGLRLPLDWWPTIAKALDIDVRTLGDAVVARAAERKRKGAAAKRRAVEVRQTRVPGAEKTRTLVPGNDEQGSDPVERREFFTAAAGAAGWLALWSPEAAVAKGRRVGPTDVARVRQRVSDLRRLDDYTGGESTYPLAMTEVCRTAGLLRNSAYTEATGNQLMSALAETGQFAAWVAFDCGRTDEAKRLAMTATKAANQAGDRMLAASTLSELSYLTASADPHGEAVEMARASWANAPADLLPAVRVVLADRLAYAHARAGSAGGVSCALGLSADAHDRRDTADREEPDWVYWINRDESQIMAGRCWSELSRPDKALPVWDAVTAPYDETHAREVALYLLWTAGSHVDAGDVEQAVQTADRAVTLAGVTASPRTDAHVSSLVARLKPYSDLPAVRDLAARTAA